MCWYVCDCAKDVNSAKRLEYKESYITHCGRAHTLFRINNKILQTRFQQNCENESSVKTISNFSQTHIRTNTQAHNWWRGLNFSFGKAWKSLPKKIITRNVCFSKIYFWKLISNSWLAQIIVFIDQVY